MLRILKPVFSAALASIIGFAFQSCAHALKTDPGVSNQSVQTVQPLEAVLLGLSRQIRDTLTSQNARRVAIPNLVTHTGLETELGAYLADKLTNALFDRGPGLEVVDRIHLKSIIDESEIGAQVGDIETIQSLGKVLGADALVVGTVTDLGDKYDVTLRMVETEKARVLATASGFIHKTPWVEKLHASQIPRPAPLDRRKETAAALGSAPPAPGKSSGTENARPESPKSESAVKLVENKVLRIEVLGMSKVGTVLFAITNKSTEGISVGISEHSRMVWAGGSAGPWSGGSINYFSFCDRIRDSFFVQPGVTEEGTVEFSGVPPDKRLTLKAVFGWKFGNGSCERSDEVNVYFRG